MSSIKTFLTFSLVAAGLAAGVRGQRQFDLEANASVRAAIEAAVRANAVEYNPKVQLVAPELKNFDMTSFMITRPRVLGLMDDNSGYDVYVRFNEGGNSQCMTLSLEWLPRTETWKATHSGVVDSCAPSW